MITGDVFKILIIDDDDDDFLILKGLFSDIRGSRFELTQIKTYQDGLAALRADRHDACLLDYRLGAHSGLELLRETKDDRLNCPIILLTGYGDFEVDIMAMQTGAADYLVKSQLTSQLLDRSVRYSMKHALDLKELRESRAQILQQDRLASLGLLASSLAHEIGTPMGIIRSRAELVAKRSADNETTRNDMVSIVTQIDKIAKLVQSLLNLAREKRSDFSGYVQLDSVIGDVLNLVQHELTRKGIDIEVVGTTNFEVKAESGPLGQVLLNLLVNAIHAIETAKKSQTTELPHKIQIAVVARNNHVEIAISDTGCGISEKNLTQLFKPFFTTKDIGQGTGLGLATSLNLVQSWGGNITTQNNADRGATFTIFLTRNKK